MAHFLTDFKLSWWLITDADSVLGLLHHEDGVGAVSIVKVKECKCVETCPSLTVTTMSCSTLLDP
jgi:hypothetical protein